MNLRDLYLDQTGEACSSGDLDVVNAHLDNNYFVLLKVDGAPTDYYGDCGGPAPMDCQQASWDENDRQYVHIAGEYI